MTDTDTQKLAELLAKATPGPWSVGKPFPSHQKGNPVTPIYAAQEGCSSCGSGVGNWLIAWLFKNSTANTAANADLIVAAVNALPTLLAHITALEAQVAGADAQVAEAIEPVLHWYQSDEHDPRPIAEIIADIVTDLQEDRKAALGADARVSQLQVGDLVHTPGPDDSERGQRWRNDWHGDDLFISGISYDKDGLNYTVSTNWPPKDWTDGFRDGDLFRATAIREGAGV